MRQLGKILLAFTLRCGETSNDTMRSKRTPPPTAKKSETLQKWTNKSIGMARTTETTEMTERTGMTGMTGTTAPPETIELPLRRSARTKKDATTENPAPPKVPANWKTENTEKTGTTGTIEKPETLEKPEKSANGKGIFD